MRQEIFHTQVYPLWQSYFPPNAGLLQAINLHQAQQTDRALSASALKSLNLFIKYSLKTFTSGTLEQTQATAIKTGVTDSNRILPHVQQS